MDDVKTVQSTKICFILYCVSFTIVRPMVKSRMQHCVTMFRQISIPCWSNTPIALAIITGDFNPKSTGFNVKDLTHANNIKQMVKFKTRDSGTLDWFLTNMPNLFDLSQLPKISASDHFTILARPVTPSLNSRTDRKVRVRDMRESAWRPFGRWMLEKDWTNVLEAASCKEKFQLFSSELKGLLSFYCHGDC